MSQSTAHDQKTVGWCMASETADLRMHACVHGMCERGVCKPEELSSFANLGDAIVYKALNVFKAVRRTHTPTRVQRLNIVM